MRLQRGNGLFRRLNFRHGDAQRLGNGAVVFAAQLCQEPGGNVHGVGDGFFLPAQLQHQTLRQIPRAHTGRLQRLQKIQRLIHHGLRDLHFRQAVQILLRQIAVLIHHLRQIFGQRQQRL